MEERKQHIIKTLEKYVNGGGMVAKLMCTIPICFPTGE